MTLALPEGMIGEMIAHAFEDLPNECCGMITAKDGVAKKLFRTRNVEGSPYRYNIDPRDLLKIEREADENGWQIMVIYHSHVASAAYPSPTDVRLSQWPGTEPPIDLYPGAHYVLVSLKKRADPRVRAFRIHTGKVIRQRLVATA